jgi:hypothetical protein
MEWLPRRTDSRRGKTEPSSERNGAKTELKNAMTIRLKLTPDNAPIICVSQVLLAHFGIFILAHPKSLIFFA